MRGCNRLFNRNGHNRLNRFNHEIETTLLTTLFQFLQNKFSVHYLSSRSTKPSFALLRSHLSYAVTNLGNYRSSKLTKCSSSSSQLSLFPFEVTVGLPVLLSAHRPLPSSERSPVRFASTSKSNPGGEELSITGRKKVPQTQSVSSS